jgi:hypothetical protein
MFLQISDNRKEAILAVILGNPKKVEILADEQNNGARGCCNFLRFTHPNRLTFIAILGFSLAVGIFSW